MASVGRGRFGVRGRLVAATAAGAIVLLATAAPVMARNEQFTVNFAASGLYTGRTTDHVVKLNGLCNDTATERTSFSFTGVGILNVSFDKKGMTGDSYKLPAGSGDWARAQAAPTRLTKSSTGAGCNPPFGADMSGHYDCTGTAVPQSDGVSEFKLTSAARGKTSNLRVIGPDKFTDTDLGGSWTYQTGSCRDLGGATLLQTMSGRTPSALGPRVPFNERKLRHLRVGEYLMVDVGEGQYAPTVNDAQQCASNKGLDTCRQTFGWTGRVFVKRVK
jgi:hypothetical protein